MERAAIANKKALALLLKPASPTPSNTGSLRSFHRDTDKGIKVRRYCEVNKKLHLSHEDSEIKLKI